MNKPKQEALIYLAVALSALFFMCYAVHMLVGGLVSAETDYTLMAVVCVIGIAAMGFMAWDVIEHRRRGAANGEDLR